MILNANKSIIYTQNIISLNKAGHQATPVACGWGGAIFELTRAFGQEQYGQKIKNIKKKCDQPTDRQNGV